MDMMPNSPQQKFLVDQIREYLEEHLGPLDHDDSHTFALEIWRLIRTQLRPVQKEGE